MEISKPFVGREKKGKRLFLPLVFLRGSEDVEKPETKRRPKAGGRRSSARSGL